MAEVPRDLMKTPSSGNKQQNVQNNTKLTPPSGGDNKMWKQQGTNGGQDDKKDMYTNLNGDHWAIGSFLEKPMMRRKEVNFPSP